MQRALKKPKQTKQTKKHPVKLPQFGLILIQHWVAESKQETNRKRKVRLMIAFYTFVQMGFLLTLSPDQGKLIIC